MYIFKPLYSFILNINKFRNDMKGHVHDPKPENATSEKNLEL